MGIGGYRISCVAIRREHSVHSFIAVERSLESMSASQIRPIEQESVQRIVAGQAVHDLASAVKELVDNSLDAGSKSINSKL